MHSLMTAVLPLIIISAISVSYASADVPFKHTVIDQSPPESPWAKLTGDFNGDTYPDIVVGGRLGPLVLYTWPEWIKTVIADGGYNTVDGEAGDMDNDGDLDIVMGGLVWYENPLPDRKPDTVKWSMHRIADHPTHDVELGDLDRDGDLDIVTRDQSEFGHEGGNEIHVWLNNDDGWKEYVIQCPHGEGVTLADLDSDNDIDIVINGLWYENDKGLAEGKWQQHKFAEFHRNATVFTGDLDNDGDQDIVLTPSELKGQEGYIAWHERTGMSENGLWKEHRVDSGVECVYHSLEIADMDFDGFQDIVTAEMHQGTDPDEVAVYFNPQGNGTWNKQIVSTKGSHYIRITDIGCDGDMDFIGANHGGDYPALELWENQTSGNNPRLDKWTYIEVDSKRAKWGDWDDPKWCKYFGLASGDITGDGQLDIVSGRYFYKNPGGDMSGIWHRTDFGSNVDAVLITDVDGDNFGDVIAEALPDVYWLEVTDRDDKTWHSKKIAEIPKTGHGNGQGYATADILKGGKPEILLSSGDGIYMLTIPDNPSADSWTALCIAPEATEEGIGFGDIDGDGDLDIAAGSGEKKGDGMNVSWWENPGATHGIWHRHHVGETIRFADRFAIADFNGDNRPDIAVSEERWPEPEDAHVFWFEQKPDTGWKRHIVTVQNTSNNLDVADMDNDGDIDIVSAEHRGTEKVSIFENVGNASKWICHAVSFGKESHLGARLFDLDNDGDLDIVSICWDDHQFLHLWRNDAIRNDTGQISLPKK